MDIAHNTDSTGVDWDALKTAVTVDNFDNGCTPGHMRLACENSAVNVFADDGAEIVGNPRALSDGVCNAYVVDMWTKMVCYKRGIARRMMEIICERVPGQHINLAADDDVLGFYAKLGFTIDGHGLARVVGRWLHNETLDP